MMLASQLSDHELDCFDRLDGMDEMLTSKLSLAYDDFH